MLRSRLKTYHLIRCPASATIVGLLPMNALPLKQVLGIPAPSSVTVCVIVPGRPAHETAWPHLHLGRVEAHVEHVGVDDRDRRLLLLAGSHDDLPLHLLVDLAVVRVRRLWAEGHLERRSCGREQSRC